MIVCNWPLMGHVALQLQFAVLVLVAPERRFSILTHPAAQAIMAMAAIGAPSMMQAAIRISVKAKMLMARPPS